MNRVMSGSNMLSTYCFSRGLDILIEDAYVGSVMDELYFPGQALTTVRHTASRHLRPDAEQRAL